MKSNTEKTLKLLLMAVTIPLLFILTPLLSLPLDAQEKIPACMLSYKFGPEQYVVVVEKSTQSLLIYSNYKPEPVDRFKITTGKKNGRKLVEGDLKTPEGIYFFRRILSGEELPKVDDYGEKAFTLNYPNAIDHKEKRNGSGIWLHGAFDENKTDSPYNSRGCVVMKNNDLIQVSKYIYLNETPICIYEKIRYDTVENIQKKRDRLIKHLKAWKQNWEDKNIDGYIGYYYSGFRSDGMNLARFKAYKNNLNKNYKFIRVILSDINIYSFDGYHVMTFNQLYISDINHFYSKKIQYWSNGGSDPQIVDERTIGLPKLTRFEVSKGNYITVDRFRGDYIANQARNTIKFSPANIHLKQVMVRDKMVRVSLDTTGGSGGMKVIPVLRFQHQETNDTRFLSLDGVSLKNGMPEDYSGAIPLNRGATTMTLKRDDKFRLKRLTLVIVNRHNQFEQVITYFLDKD